MKENMEEIIIKDVSETECTECKENYKLRVLDEFKDLHEKRVLLGKYIKENVNKVQTKEESLELDLLRDQLKIMYKYEEILYVRLSYMLDK